MKYLDSAKFDYIILGSGKSKKQTLLQNLVKMEFYKLFSKHFLKLLDHLKIFYFKEKLNLLVKNQSWNRTSKRKAIIEHKIWGLKIWLSKKNSAAKCFLICWFPRAYVLGLICLKHILSKVQVKLYNCPIRIEQKPQKCNECCWRVEQLKQTLYIEQRKLGMLYIPRCKYLAYQWYFSRPNIVDLDELKDVPFLQL